MPCRSSRASIPLRPRDNCERSRRPIGASGGAGGAAGFGAADFLADPGGAGAAVDFATAVSSAGRTASAFPARALLRSGLACLATLSHSTCSSSLRLRLRRGGGGRARDRGEGGVL